MFTIRTRKLSLFIYLSVFIYLNIKIIEPLPLKLCDTYFLRSHNFKQNLKTLIYFPAKLIVLSLKIIVF